MAGSYPYGRFRYRVECDGLSEYFFFDGESMIADLRVKGKDSANKLRKAIYSMFDLDIIESALTHIGRIDLKTTALGKLYLSKGQIASGSKIASIKTNIESAQNAIDSNNSEINKAKDEKKQKKELIESISEAIGSTKSKASFYFILIFHSFTLSLQR